VSEGQYQDPPSRAPPYKFLWIAGLIESLEEYILQQDEVPRNQQWTEYLTKQAEFNPTRACWTHFADKPELFWASTVCIIPLLYY
jgi:hypothetical protein